LEDHENPNNDRLIFSKGHASPLFFALYAVAGKISEKEMLTLRKFGSRLEGHPTSAFPYTEVPTGSLGQGLSVGVGMALNAKKDKLSYKTYVLLGDSEMAEGSIWEAMAAASFYKLDNLVAIVDVNRLGQRGETMLGFNNKFKQREKVLVELIADGHNVDEIHAYQKSQRHIYDNRENSKGSLFIEDKDGKTFSQKRKRLLGVR
jgi:transketolase